MKRLTHRIDYMEARRVDLEGDTTLEVRIVSAMKSVWKRKLPYRDGREEDLWSYKS